jgi:hypothetical protein
VAVVVLDKVTVRVAVQVPQQVEQAVATLVMVAAQVEPAVVTPMVLVLLVVKVVPVAVLAVTQAQAGLVVMVISTHRQPLVELVPVVQVAVQVAALVFTEMVMVQVQELVAAA